MCKTCYLSIRVEAPLAAMAKAFQALWITLAQCQTYAVEPMKVEIIFEDEVAACEMVKICLDVRQKATAGLIREAAKMGSLSALFKLHLSAYMR